MLPAGHGLTFITIREADGKANLEQLMSDRALTAHGSNCEDSQKGTVPGTDGCVYANIHCYECNQYGHYIYQCQKVNDGNCGMGQQHLMVCFSFTQQTCGKQQQQHGVIPCSWVVLDNQSTVDIFCNKQLLENMHQANLMLEIHSNVCVLSTNMLGDLPGVWASVVPPKRHCKYPFIESSECMISGCSQQ